ncbi:uncharacterized protein [Vicugna pacos]|uniref:Uncharacterized protein n=1 Tax=Vicugna pacos TaxID=30538 RepID=A0ABM5DUG0_VICPA
MLRKFLLKQKSNMEKKQKSYLLEKKKKGLTQTQEAEEPGGLRAALSDRRRELSTAAWLAGCGGTSERLHETESSLHFQQSQIQSRRGQGKMPETKNRTIRIQQETPSSLLLLLQLLQLQQLTLLLKILPLLLLLTIPQLLLLLKVPQLLLLPKVLKMLHLQLDRWATDSQFRRHQPLGLSPLCAHPHLLLQNPTMNPLPHPTLTSVPLK